MSEDIEEIVETEFNDIDMDIPKIKLQDITYEYRFKIYVNLKPDGKLDIVTSNPFQPFSAIDFYADLSGTGEEQKRIMSRINEHVQSYKDSGVTDINIYDKNKFPDLKKDWATIFNIGDTDEQEDSDVFVDTARTKIAILFGNEPQSFIDSKENNEYMAYYTAEEYSFDIIENMLLTYPGIKIIDIFTDISINAFDNEFIEAVHDSDKCIQIINDINGYNITQPSKYNVSLNFRAKDCISAVIINE